MGGDRRAEATVLLKPPGGTWEAVAGGEARGVVPEGLTCSANEGGPDSMSFAVRRDPSIEWPDLAAFNQCEVQIDGSPVWGGRVWEAPQMAGAEDIIQVQGRGWQYHMDDDPVDVYFVHTDLGEWRDMKTLPQTNLFGAPVAGYVSAGQGATIFGWQNGAFAINNTGVGITLDLGPNRVAKRVVVEFEKVNAHVFAEIHCKATDDGDPFTGGGASFAFSTSFNTITSPASGTFSTARRYVHLFMYRVDGISSTLAAEYMFRALSIKVFAATAYESGGASVLTLADVITACLATGNAPLLSSDLSQVAASSFAIPDLSPQGYQTIRSIIAAANAYEGNLVGVDQLGRVFSRERATVPDIEIGEWSGAQFNDTSTNSAEGIYNRVIVQGQTPAGAPVSVMRTATSSLLARQGFNRTAIFPVSSPITDLIAEQLGDIWLAERSQPKFKGTATVEGYGGARRVAGGGVHASELLLHYGGMLRVGNLVTPDGQVARDGVIRSVQYTHDDQRATVELDNERGKFATFLERLGVLTAQAIR